MAVKPRCRNQIRITDDAHAGCRDGDCRLVSAHTGSSPKSGKRCSLSDSVSLYTDKGYTVIFQFHVVKYPPRAHGRRQSNRPAVSPRSAERRERQPESALVPPAGAAAPALTAVRAGQAQARSTSSRTNESNERLYGCVLCGRALVFGKGSLFSQKGWGVSL